MTPEERRAAVKALLDKQPGMSQRAIARTLGCSQPSVARDMAALGLSPGPVVNQTVALGVSSLPSRGESLVAHIVAEMRANGLEPDSREEELLSLARGMADRLEALERMIAKDGMSRKVGGRIVIHPALAEARQVENTLARCLSHIQLEETHKNPVKQRAAQTRWRSHNLAKMERERRAADPFGS
jgi:transposase-like protein